MVKLGIRVSDFSDRVATVTLFIQNGNPDDTAKSFARLSENTLREFIEKCDFGIWSAKGDAPKWWQQIF